MISRLASSRTTTGLALSGSAALLAGAYAFQYIGGLAPCEMCLWQRMPHWGVLVIGALALAVRQTRMILPFLTVILLVSAGLGVYHAGVEYHWWLGPQRCTVPNISTDISAIITAPIIMCDHAAWRLFGISMAGYNGLISLAMAVFVFLRWRQK